MHLLAEVQEVQIPLLSLLLISGSVTKVLRVVRVGSMDVSLGPTALFPMRLRRPLVLVICALELGLGIGLIATAGPIGRGVPATCLRLGTGLLFLVATCSLLELRAMRPNVGCGCFGDFSQAPVSWRTLTRSALLAVAALGTIGLSPLHQPHTMAAALELLGLLAAELTLIVGLSPELGETLIRLGYSEPCELRIVPADRTLATVLRSKQWRRHAGLITADVPTDTWRELCWRYLVFPARSDDREAEIVFAVYLRHRGPQIHTVLVDAVTGQPLPWMATTRSHWRRGPEFLGLSKSL
ncbi:MAG: MauE/DoxX family redox-associated membrane protein [Streptosporangiaceae bacterium]